MLGYIDFRRSILRGAVPEFTCLVGRWCRRFTTPTAIRDACDESISGHAEKIEADVDEAMKLYGVIATWTTRSLALHIQAVLQGALILAKAKAAWRSSSRASNCAAMSNFCSTANA